MSALQPLAPDLWIADMPLSRGGFDIGARMTAVRLPDGELWLHSPIHLDEDLKRGLEALGPVGYLVSPSGLHYQHVAEFSRAYPEAKVYAAPGSREKIKDVPVHGVLGDTPEPAWAEVLDQVPFRGSWLYDEVVFLHRPSRTLILTDLCFYIAEGPASTRFWASLFGFWDRFNTSRSFGLTVRDRAAVRASLERILAWDFDRVIISHGKILETDGKAAFRRVFGRHL